MSHSPRIRNTIPMSVLYLVLAQLSARAVLGQISNPPSVTAAPDSNIGFWMSGTLAHGTECSEGYTFTASKTFVNCCAVTDTNCIFITKCRSSEVIWSHGANEICSPGASCGSAVVLDNYKDPQTRWSWIFCDTKGIQNLTIYRNWDRSGQLGPPLITVTDSVSSKVPLPPVTSTAQLSPTTFTSAEISTATSSPQAGSTASPTPTSTSVEISNSSVPPETPSTTSSKAWIAGAIAGPVAALTALGVFAFWWKRRRAKEPPENPVPDDLTRYHEAPVQSPKTDREVFELPTSRSPVFELESRESKRAGDPKAVELGLPSPVYELE